MKKEEEREEGGDGETQVFLHYFFFLIFLKGIQKVQKDWDFFDWLRRNVCIFIWISIRVLSI